MNALLDPAFNGLDLLMVLLALAGIGAAYIYEGKQR
jgi:hypothetical protein